MPRVPGPRAPRARAQSISEGVARLLNDCARSAGAHKASAKLLWELHAEDSQVFTKQLLACLNHVLLVVKGDKEVDRVVHFLVIFFTQQPAGRQEECGVLVEGLMTYLLGLTTAVDKCVRVRVCQMLADIFNNLPQDAEVTEEIADKLQEAMLERMKDKAPLVRAQAVKALCRLADPGEDESFAADPVTDAYLHTLSTDSNKEVRKDILTSVTPCPRSMPYILQRASDVNDEVRRHVYVIMRNKIPLASLSVPQRILLLEKGLGDRCQNVCKAAAAMLQSWMQNDCGGDFGRLLKALDVSVNEAVACQALNAMLSSNAFNGLRITKGEKAWACVPGGISLAKACQAKVQLSAEAALFWRVFCEWLASNASSRSSAAATTFGAAAEVTAAAAGEYLEALDRALPETVESFLDFITIHSAEDQMFLARQLFLTAARCLDFADGQGSAAGKALLEKLITQPAGVTNMELATGWWEALEELASRVLPEPEVFASLFLGTAWCLQEEFGLGGTQNEAAVVQWCNALQALSFVLRKWPVKKNQARAIPAETTESLQRAMVTMAIPATKHTDGDVRVLGVKVLGLYSLLGAQFTVTSGHLSPLVRALQAGPMPEQIMAAKALCDVALFQGTSLRALPLVPLDSSDDEGADACPVDAVQLLMELLNTGFEAQTAKTEGQSAYSVVAEGLAKLLIHHQMMPNSKGLQDGEAVRVLIALLLLHFSPGTESQTRMRQCLVVTFDNYARLHPSHHRLLCKAFLPTLRQAMMLRDQYKRSSAAKNLVGSVARFLTQLLQMDVSNGKGSTEEIGPDMRDLGHEDLAEQILQELLCVPKSVASKPYISALCKAVVALPLDRQATTALKRLYVLGERVQDSSKLDKPAAKDIAAFVTQVRALDVSEGEPLSEEALQDLIKAISMHDPGQDLLDLLGSTKQRTATRRTRRSRADSSDDDSSFVSSSTSAVSAPAEKRQLPARRARAAAAKAAQPAELSDSESSDSKDESDGAIGASTDDDDDFQDPPSRSAGGRSFVRASSENRSHGGKGVSKPALLNRSPLVEQN